jgi:hypothetical protein
MQYLRYTRFAPFSLSNTGLHPYLVHGTFDAKLHSVFEVPYTDNVNRL